jgi:hypothetical protein
MADPLFSPDGQFMWDGSQWIPAPPASQPQATHGLGTNLHDSVMQATGDIIQGTSTRIDQVVINQTSAQPVQSTIPTAPVTPSTENCTNCLQPITLQNTRLKCQFINHKNQASCTETFCSSCELWWTQTARPPSIAPLCRTHFEAKKQDRRTQNKQDESQFICYNVIERHFVAPQSPLTSETKKKMIFIPNSVGLAIAIFAFLINLFELHDAFEKAVVSVLIWASVSVLGMWSWHDDLMNKNLEYRNYITTAKARKTLLALELNCQHQEVIQKLADLKKYQTLNIYIKTYGLED